MEKREEIKVKVIELLEQSRRKMEENIDRILDSGAVAVEAYEGGYFLPKVIAVALLREEMGQHSQRTKNFTREVDNLMSF